MEAIILVGGRGVRIRALTGGNIPKQMLRINKKPILQHVLEALPSKINKIILVIGDNGEHIKEYFGDSFSNIPIEYIRQLEPKGTTDALMNARSVIKGKEFMVLHGDDLYCKKDLEKLFIKKPSLLVAYSDNPERFGVCLVDDSGFLKEILEKRKNPPSKLVNIGAFILNHEIFNIPPSILPNGELNLPEQIGVWAKRRPIKVVKASFWKPINTSEEFFSAQNK